MLTNELPIYKDTFDLVSLLMDYVAQFPKFHKHTVGQKISGMIAKGWWMYAYISGHFEKVSVVNRYKASKAVRQKALDIRKGIYYQK